jgi:hypothetical protein
MKDQTHVNVPPLGIVHLVEATAAVIYFIFFVVACAWTTSQGEVVLDQIVTIQSSGLELNYRVAIRYSILFAFLFSFIISTVSAWSIWKDYPTNNEGHIGFAYGIYLDSINQRTSYVRAIEAVIINGIFINPIIGAIMGQFLGFYRFAFFVFIQVIVYETESQRTNYWYILLAILLIGWQTITDSFIVENQPGPVLVLVFYVLYQLASLVIVMYTICMRENVPYTYILYAHKLIELLYRVLVGCFLLFLIQDGTTTAVASAI